MKIVFISDTHLLHDAEMQEKFFEKHFDIKIPDGDILIHAGDATFRGSPKEIISFSKWFGSLPHPVKIFCPGNHDMDFDGPFKETAKSLLDPSIIYLENSGVEIEGLKIYGSPATPKFYDWSFMYERGEQIRRIWDLIPNGLDILITHGPPYGILDRNRNGIMCGCEELLEAVKVKKPRIHCFGHIHPNYGDSVYLTNDTMFVNAAICNENYEPINLPVVVSLNAKDQNISCDS